MSAERLTPNFLLSEVLRNSGAATLPAELVPEARAHANALERVRALLGNRPIVPTSWYRVPDRNASVGGKSNSHHLRARATDFKVSGMTPHEVMIALAGPASDGAPARAVGVDVAVEYAGHVHVSTSPSGHARGILLTHDANKGEEVPWNPKKSATDGQPPKGSVAWWAALIAAAAVAVLDVLSRFR